MKIIHRDLKPENIFMNKNMEIKIGDFGISKQLNREYTITKNKRGTEYYIAPEILKEGKFNEKSDIWSLGCIIYELFHLSNYYMDKFMNEIKKIDKEKYNYKWQELIDLILVMDYNKRIDINKVFDILEKININKQEHNNKIIINNEININREDINNNNLANRYIFPIKGLNNIGATCYMNATLQCLLHVNDLIVYFIDEYPKDHKSLLNINKDAPTGGDISRAFFNLVNGVCESEDMTKSRKLNPEKSYKGYSFNYLGFEGPFSPDEFKRTLGVHNPKFRKFEECDSKDLILYLLQTMHKELNYFGNKNQESEHIPNKYDLLQAYSYFHSNYNNNNSSKISLLFFGTYMNTTKCNICKKILYNFQKFEFISFGMFNYNKHKFNLIDGFKDNSRTGLLTGDNKFFCQFCNKKEEAETTCKIFEPPKYLLINIDYGKNKKYQPSSIEFDDIIDITQFVAFDYKQNIKYKILGVCTHYGYSGRFGHYVAYCRNRENNWYEFNDSMFSECSRSSINRGSPCSL